MLSGLKHPVLFLLSTFAAQWAFATGDAQFVWDESGTFKSATNCEVRTEKHEFSGRLKDLGLNVIEMKDQDSSLRVGTVTFPVEGTFWQAATEGENAVTFVCQDEQATKTYVVFDVFVPEQLAPIARVGVDSDNSSLFQSIQIHSPDAAEKLVGSRSLQSLTKEELSNQPRAASLTAGIKAVQGALEYVVCTSASNLNVRDESLSKILFTVGRHDPAKPVQSFGTDKMEKVIDGRTYRFMKVQFPNRTIDPNIGWVAEDFILLKSQCGNFVETPPAPVTPGTPSNPDRIETWNFPTLKRPTDSYKTGQRKFKANRDGGNRLHAAADLYRVDGEVVTAVTSGKIIRDRYFFYQGTYAIEVQHTGGKVVRYGEVKGKSAPNAGLNNTVEAGQAVGYIGTVNSGCCKPMLHFEMYAGTATGALSQSGNKFNRRKDLMDPTDFLTQWERTKFGQSY